MLPEFAGFDDLSREEFEFSYARSGGPGGQNVNKVNSKVILRWAVARSPSLSEEVRARFLSKYAARLTAAGEVIVTSQKYRDQNRNLEDCIHKLRSMLASVFRAPAVRVKTKPSRSAVEKRLQSKHSTSERKMLRRKPGQD